MLYIAVSCFQTNSYKFRQRERLAQALRKETLMRNYLCTLGVHFRKVASGT